MANRIVSSRPPRQIYESKMVLYLQLSDGHLKIEDVRLLYESQFLKTMFQDLPTSHKEGSTLVLQSISCHVMAIVLAYWQKCGVTHRRHTCVAFLDKMIGRNYSLFQEVVKAADFLDTQRLYGALRLLAIQRIQEMNDREFKTIFFSSAPV